MWLRLQVGHGNLPLPTRGFAASTKVVVHVGMLMAHDCRVGDGWPTMCHASFARYLGRLISRGSRAHLTGNCMLSPRGRGTEDHFANCR